MHQLVLKCLDIEEPAIQALPFHYLCLVFSFLCYVQ